MEHYFSSKTNAEHKYIEIEYFVKDITINLTTDRGVFSRNKVDFGSDLLIKSVPELKGNILDLGCGYGPVGISMAKMNPDAQVLMADINERAVELSIKNIEKNKVLNAKAIVSDSFSNISQQFSTILLNPPIRTGKQNIYRIFDNCFENLTPSGCLFIVIQKKQGAPSAKEKLSSLFGNCDMIAKKDGYYIYKCEKN